MRDWYSRFCMEVSSRSEAILLSVVLIKSASEVVMNEALVLASPSIWLS